MDTDGRRLALLVALCGLLALSGCAQLAVHSTVTADGTIEEYRMEINTSRTVYGLLESSAQENGYDSVRASFLADLNESRAEQVSYDEAFDGDRVRMTITITDYDPTANDNISVTRTDGKLVYEDRTFYNESWEPSDAESGGLGESVLAGLAVDYYLTMPGEITDSNADEVDGKTAEWHATGADAFQSTRVYAESDVPTGASLPGFGVVAAVFGLLCAAYLLGRR